MYKGSTGTRFTITHNGDVTRNSGWNIRIFGGNLMEGGWRLRGCFSSDLTDLPIFQSTAIFQANDDNYHSNAEGESFQEQLINATLGVIGDGSTSGIGFYQTNDKDKVKFVKVEPPKPPEKKATWSVVI